jgi:hypothetical protein
MSTILESPPQVTTAPPRVPTAAPPQATPPKTRRRTVAIVVAVIAAIAALVGIGLAVWWVNQPETTTTTTGAVYTDAVPHPGSAAAAMYAARDTELFGAYGPASTVYTEQVPALAAVTAVPETFGYGSQAYQTYRAQAAFVPPPDLQGSPWSEWPPPATSANVVPRLHQAAPFEWTSPAAVVTAPHQAAPFE